MNGFISLPSPNTLNESLRICGILRMNCVFAECALNNLNGAYFAEYSVKICVYSTNMWIVTAHNHHERETKLYVFIGNRKVPSRLRQAKTNLSKNWSQKQSRDVVYALWKFNI